MCVRLSLIFGWQALEAMEKAKASWGSLLWRAALNEAMGHHLDAADNYVKERSFKYTRTTAHATATPPHTHRRT